MNGHHSDGYVVAAKFRTTSESMKAVSKMPQLWMCRDGGQVASIMFCQHVAGQRKG